MFFQCCSVCIPPHRLVPMIQSLYQTLPCFPSAVPEPTSSLLGSVGDTLGWGQNRPEHLANIVAPYAVSSNHVVADQPFWNITTLPHLHVFYASWYILMYSLMLLCDLAKGVL